VVFQKRYVMICVSSQDILNCMISKAQLPSLPVHFDGSGSADHMFDELLQKVQVVYDCCPAYLAQESLDVKPSFEWSVCSCIVYFLPLPSCNRKHVVFGVQKGTAVSCIDESYLCGTVAEFFGHIKLGNLLSEMDVKHHKLQLHLFVYPSDSQYVEVVCSIEYLEL
jgi:hypothetical protein